MDTQRTVRFKAVTSIAAIVSVVTLTGVSQTFGGQLMPPSIEKSFNPSTIVPNGVSLLTVTITNPDSSLPLVGIAFADVFPSGLVVNTPSGLTNTCGGTATATANSNNVMLSGGTLAGGANCTVSVLVTAAVMGTYGNTSGDVSSTNGGTGNSASATLDVQLPPTDTPTATPTHTVTVTATPTITPTVTTTPTVTPTGTPVAQGGACATSSQCATGFCADSVCCDTACSDPLMRCNLPGQVGTCASAAAAAPTLTPWGLIFAALLLTGVAAFALRYRMRGR